MVCFERYVLPCRLVFPKAFLAECLSSSWNIPLSDSLYLNQQRIMSALPCCHAICHDDSFNVEIECPGKQKTPVPVGTGV